jgi:hypothetical protein
VRRAVGFGCAGEGEAVNERRYGNSALSPKGIAFRPGFCAEEVWDPTRWRSYQCTRKATVGEYCKQHSKRHRVLTTRSEG